MSKVNKTSLRCVESDGGITEEQLEELKALETMPDEDIDLSDIPEITDWSGTVIGKFYRPVKETVTLRLDADVLHWLKQGGKGYQTRLNSILRREMTASIKKRKAA
ncbi:MAG: BrnA antitoxin family protein [Deltaproteobacteria bacterium]|nr:BrnA antitoxin family protein [Deltaproteobacteria bacterium]